MNADRKNGHQYYEGPDPKTLGSFGKKVELVVNYLSSLNGTTRLELSIKEVPEPWRYGEDASLAFNLDEEEKRVVSFQLRNESAVLEGVLYGSGGTPEIRQQSFKLLGFNRENLKPVTSQERIGSYSVVNRLALVGN